MAVEQVIPKQCQDCPLLPLISEKIARQMDDYYLKADDIQSMYYQGHPAARGLHNQLRQDGEVILRKARNLEVIVGKLAAEYSCGGPLSSALDPSGILVQTNCPIDARILSEFGAS